MAFFTWLGIRAATSRQTKTKASRQRRKATCKLQVEPLEDRCLLASGLSASLVADVVPGAASSYARNLTSWNGTLFFTTGHVPGYDDNGGYGSSGLWKSDGTAAGTTLVKSFGGNSWTGPVFNGSMFFTADYGLWKSDGTTAGTVFVKQFQSVGGMAPVNGKLLLVGDDGKTGSELWVTDGTTKGTVLLKDIFRGAADSGTFCDRDGCYHYSIPNSSNPALLASLNGTVLFSADDGKNGRELWRTDGTSGGTKLVKDIAAGSAGSHPTGGTVLNGFVYFGAAGGLWKTNGTAAGTVLVKNVYVPFGLTNVSGTLFFASDGGELWKSDGTTAGTVPVKDIPGTGPALVRGWRTNVNATLFFVADDGVHGQELWKSDGTSAGTVLVRDIAPGNVSAFPNVYNNPWLTNVNGLLYFAANDGASGVELWQSDGTAEGTMMVRDIYPGSMGSRPEFLLAMNNKLYFAATDPEHGRELWDPPAVEPAGEYLLVPSFDTDNLLRYDGATGAFVDEFVPHKSGGLNQPAGVVFGPHDGNLYVGSGYYGGPGQLRGVLRYNGSTGKFMNVFTEPGHLEKVNQILFGPDGNGDGLQDLYVSNGRELSEGGVVRFDGITGAFIDDFVPPVAGRLRGPCGMVFGPSPDRPGRLDLYVTSAFYGNVLRFDGRTGVFLDEFIAHGRGGLDAAVGVTFGPDGNLYVTSSGFTWPSGVDGNAAVLRFQGANGRSPGAFIDTFVPKGSGGLLDASGVLFGPDGNGDGRQDLYVTSAQLSASYQTKEHTSSVKRYDGVTGAFIDTFVAIGSGGLDGPWSMTFTKTDPMTLAYTGDGRLTAASLPARPTKQMLAVEQAQPLLSEALARWQAAGVDTSVVGSIQIEITNLGRTTLSLAAGHTIWLDDNAAGWGWFVDRRPWDFEFATPGDLGEQNRMDLLTALAHEIGHLLGYEHEQYGVMQESLSAEERLTLHGVDVNESWWLAGLPEFTNKRDPFGWWQ